MTPLRCTSQTAVLAISTFLVSAPETSAAPLQPPSRAASVAFSSDTFDREAQLALTSVSQSSGVDLPGKITVRVASRQQLANAMREDQRRYFRQFTGTPGHTDRDIQQATTWILAKYAVAEKSILVVPENFVQQARATGETWLLEDVGLRLYLIHEAAHAADDLRWDLGKLLSGATNSEELNARSAVIEGHAQLTARRVCEKQGWTKSFERMTAFIGSTRGHLRTARQQVAAIRWPTITLSYRDGEAFMTHLLAEGGEAAVERAFQSPPKSLQVIAKPEWFLNPEKQLNLRYNFERALDQVADGFDLTQWAQSRTAATPAQLRDDLSGCPRQELQSLTQGLVRSRAIAFKPIASPESKSFGATLFEHTSASHASAAVAIKQSNSQRYDQTLKRQAPVRISKPTYTTIEQGACRGFGCQKQLRIFAVESEIVHVGLAAGPLEVELMSWGGAASLPALEQLAINILQQCQP